MKFQNKKDYELQRQNLINKAQSLIDEGNIDEANRIMESDIPALDNEFDSYITAQANIKAISGAAAANVPGLLEGTTGVNGDVLASLDYRRAFMNYVCSGAAIPAEYQNSNANTKTSDSGAVIPTTVMEKIFERLENSGTILSLVTKTSYKGGLSIPTATVKPTAAWLAEGAAGDRQKKSLGTVTFSYYKLKCAVSVSLEMDTMALSVFENTIINNISEAMQKALEAAIISGSGSGQPKGILAETPAAGQSIDVGDDETLSYSLLCEAEAAIPEAYENGAVWLMTKRTFMKFIEMTDENGQPIARVNYGIGGRPERSLLGRTVICNEYMNTYADTVASDTAFAAIFRMSDYILNTNLNITVKKFEDNDTDDTVTKAIMLADGKVVDKSSLVILTKKAADKD